jgi:hypothetical protein
MVMIIETEVKLSAGIAMVELPPTKDARKSYRG